MERTTEQVTALHAARLERGWSVGELVLRLRQAAVSEGVDFPLSWKNRRVLSWEAGAVPDERYRLLLSVVYERTLPELGLPDPDDADAIDAERLARIFARYNTWLVSKIYRRIGDWHLAEDLAQETFIKVGRYLSVMEPEKDADRLYSWLAMHARWVTSAHFKLARIDRECFAVTHDQDDDPYLSREPVANDECGRPEQTALGRVVIERLLAVLPTVQAQIIQLRVLDGKTQNETARALDMAPMQVNLLERQAKSALCERLTGQPLPEPEEFDLRQERQTRGWTADHLIAEIQTRCAGSGTKVPSAGSLRSYISMHENHRQDMPKRHLDTVRSILGFVTVPTAPRPIAPLEIAA